MIFEMRRRFHFKEYIPYGTQHTSRRIDRCIIRYFGYLSPMRTPSPTPKSQAVR